MEGIKFDNIHTYIDYGLILTGKTIGSPSIKTQSVDIPGSDGEIDLADYLPEKYYGNRTLSFEFEIIKKQKDYVSLFSKIQNALNGKRMKVILDIDKEFYYIGKIEVSEWKSEKRIGKIVINVNADPYKYRINPTVQSVMIGDSGEVTINLFNLKKPATPTFTFSKETTLKYGNSSISLSAGEYKLYDIRLTEGNNPITFKGEKGSIVTVTYQEGEL